MESKYGCYRNLKAELIREGVTQREVAAYLGMTSKNLNLKLNGKTAFTIPEIVSIQRRFVPDATLDYLLETTQDTALQ